MLEAVCIWNAKAGDRCAGMQTHTHTQKHTLPCVKGDLKSGSCKGAYGCLGCRLYRSLTQRKDWKQLLYFSVILHSEMLFVNQKKKKNQTNPYFIFYWDLAITPNGSLGGGVRTRHRERLSVEFLWEVWP